MSRFCEFDVSLRSIEPRIWRRFQIRLTATFAELHRAIQDSFGWQDYHLGHFLYPSEHGRVIAGVPDDEFVGLDSELIPDGRGVKLSAFFRTDGDLDGCLYLYDFGDTWFHELKLIQIMSSEERFRRRLLGGERACPPEDCGGVGGYGQLMEFLETGEDRYDGDPEGLATWLGDWRPEVFVLDSVKAAFDR